MDKFEGRFLSMEIPSRDKRETERHSGTRTLPSPCRLPAPPSLSSGFSTRSTRRFPEPIFSLPISVSFTEAYSRRPMRTGRPPF